MKITEHIKQSKGKTRFTFEILPPVKGHSIQSIYENIDPLMEFKPPFIDVTYHREEVVLNEKENGLLEKKLLKKDLVLLVFALLFRINTMLMQFHIFYVVVLIKRIQKIF